LFLKKLVADVLDGVDQFDEFDPHFAAGDSERALQARFRVETP